MSSIINLVNQVLASLPVPYTKDVIDDVFYAIEHYPTWHQEYRALCVNWDRKATGGREGEWNVNARIGSTVRRAVGMPQKLGRVDTQKSTLIKTRYSQLDLP